MKQKKILALMFSLAAALACYIPVAASSGTTSAPTTSTPATSAPATTTPGDVATAVEQTWTAAAGQIKAVVDTVVFPALDMILVIAFFGKLAMSYFDYKKHGQFEWTGPVILFVCLVFTLTAPLYIWGLIGI